MNHLNLSQIIGGAADVARRALAACGAHIGWPRPGKLGLQRGDAAGQGEHAPDPRPSAAQDIPDGADAAARCRLHEYSPHARRFGPFMTTRLLDDGWVQLSLSIELPPDEVRQMEGLFAMMAREGAKLPGMEPGR